MSLDTLLEAAIFLERQEEEEEKQKRQAALGAALSTTASIVAGPNNGVVTHSLLHTPITNITSLNQQTLVIATSHLPGAAGQSVIHTPVTSSMSESSTSKDKTADSQGRTRFIHNSFDIINPLYIDEKSNVAKRKPPPLVFRAGTREVHNKLEKHRRAHLKECFDILKKQLPSSADEKKTSNLNILHTAIRYIRMLRVRERDLEQEMERLARDKISWQNRLALLKKDLSSRYENIDFSRYLTEVTPVCRGEDIRRDSDHEVNVVEMRDEDSRTDSMEEQSQSLANTNGVRKLSLIPSKCQVQQPVQTALSVLPVSYPLNQGLVLQKLAIVPKGITDLTPLVPTFITQQQLNGKVVPLVNAQYVVGKCPLVVVSTANPRSS